MEKGLWEKRNDMIEISDLTDNLLLFAAAEPEPRVDGNPISWIHSPSDGEPKALFKDTQSRPFLSDEND